MSTVTFASVSIFRLSPRRPLTVMALFGLLVLGLCVAFPGHALDLVGFVGIAGPMTSALAQIAALGPSIKALVGFVGFVVALISLSALRNFGPVLFYVGLAIFAAVGLVIATLNDYLTEMSEAILDHHGTLVSFMGDGIMALFGALAQTAVLPFAREAFTVLRRKLRAS